MSTRWCYIPNIKTLGLMVSDKNIFLCFFPIQAYVKHVTRVRAIFWPFGYVDVHWVMLHFKYQGFRPCGFRQEDLFHASPYISLYKACDPEVGYFSPLGLNLNKLGRGLLGSDIYQTSRL